MKKLIMLVGPPGSGKSTLCESYRAYTRISQDDQGTDHLRLFNEALERGDDIIIDRMNFNISQRERYIRPATVEGYETTIIVLHTPKATCYNRCVARTAGNPDAHPTIKDEKTASKTIYGFFKNYERVEDWEADEVRRCGWDTVDTAIVTDLDGTLADLSHRLHFVRGTDDITERKKDWKSFFAAAPNDEVHEFCRSILTTTKLPIVVATARPDEYRKDTEDWLDKFDIPRQHVIMRARGDFRHDEIVKEIMLEWEVKTRYKILFWLDDRGRVVKMLRKHKVRVLDVIGEDF